MQYVLIHKFLWRVSLWINPLSCKNSSVQLDFRKSAGAAKGSLWVLSTVVPLIHLGFLCQESPMFSLSFEELLNPLLHSYMIYTKPGWAHPTYFLYLFLCTHWSMNPPTTSVLNIKLVWPGAISQLSSVLFLHVLDEWQRSHLKCLLCSYPWIPLLYVSKLTASPLGSNIIHG